MEPGADNSRDTIETTPATAISYQSAAAFDTALKARFTQAAKHGGRSVNELRRQFAYGRLLARVFSLHPDRWVLKGGAGLLARLPDQARHSMDIDLYYQGQAAAVTADLDAAADADLGDYFAFDISETGQLTGIHPGHSYRVTAFLGDTVFVEFGLDAVIATNMTGSPETVEPLAPVAVPGLASPEYRAYPTVDHIADKHAAMLDRYNEQPSSRYRDLVDLVVLATTQSVTARDLSAAVYSEYAHRGLTPPGEVTLPSPQWVEGYAAEAAKVPTLKQRTAGEALEVASALLGPILNHTAKGHWDPKTLTWPSPKQHPPSSADH